MLPGRIEAVGRLERDLGIGFISSTGPVIQLLDCLMLKLPTGTAPIFLPVVCSVYIFFLTIMDLLVADSALDLYLSDLAPDLDLTDSVPYLAYLTVLLTLTCLTLLLILTGLTLLLIWSG